MSHPRFMPFGGPPYQTDLEAARIAVLPLCYENAVSYGTGAESGPYHILEASEQLEDVDEETLEDWSRAGIHTLPPETPSSDPARAVRQMQRAADAVLRQGKFLLSLGGDHAVSIGPIQAAASVYPDVGVLQIDAHLDLRNEWNGSRFNHACVMRRVADDMALPMVQVGIRSFSKAEANLVRERGLKPVYAHMIDPSGDSWIDRVIDGLPEMVYLTVDLDGLDPSVIPGTGTPEPGGLSYRQVVRLIRSVGAARRVVAADITELAKVPGSQVSEFTAAKIATKIFVHCVPFAGD